MFCEPSTTVGHRQCCELLLFICKIQVLCLAMCRDASPGSRDSEPKVTASKQKQPLPAAALHMSRAESLDVRAQTPPSDLSKASIFSRAVGGSQPTLTDMNKVTMAPHGINTNDRRRDLMVPTRPLSMATVDHSSLSNSLPELNAPDRRSRSLLNPVTDEVIR